MFLFSVENNKWCQGWIYSLKWPVEIILSEVQRNLLTIVFLPISSICLNRFKYNIVTEISQKPKVSCVKRYSFHFIVHITLQATERKIFLKRDFRGTKQLKMPFLLFVFNCELLSEYPHDPANTLLFMLQEEVHLLVHPFWYYSLDELFQTDLFSDHWVPLQTNSIRCVMCRHTHRFDPKVWLAVILIPRSYLPQKLKPMIQNKLFDL